MLRRKSSTEWTGKFGPLNLHVDTDTSGSYTTETNRLYGVLDKHLADGDKKYLVGDKCTIADIAHYGWVASAGWAGIDIKAFPHLEAWEERMTERPGVEKGRHVPDPHRIKEILKDKAKTEEIAAKSRAWVQEGMKEDAKKHGEQK